MKYFLVFFLIFQLFFCKKETINENSSCVSCHDSHAQQADHKQVSCISCHRGDKNGITKESAHVDLISIPGNLSSVDKTCGTCHVSQMQSIQHSLMTTNSGMIAINRFVFKELDLKNSHASLKDLKPENSAADSYFVQLCSSCHLGMEKTEKGKHAGYSKGGGCLACHLDSVKPGTHPVLRRTPSDDSCFNCHSRSGRISLNFNGLAEMTEEENFKPHFVMEDGRKLKKIKEDIHKTKGMNCVSCHMSRDVMGTGEDHFHKENAVSVRCEDCHKNRSIENHEKNHNRVACSSCHSSWAPNCFGCHIKYDRDSKWIEETGESFYKLPTLGVTSQNKIQPFIPGMKLTIDTSGFNNKKEKLISQNLFAPASPHTISKESRSCKSCHSDPYALGFGAGELKFENGKWKLISEYKKEEGLPEDAWIIPFKEYKDTENLSTRKGARPFSREEQYRILEVGKCLSCHTGKEELFQEFAKNVHYHK